MIDTSLRDLRQPEYIHVLINPIPIYGLAMGWKMPSQFSPRIDRPLPSIL